MWVSIGEVWHYWQPGDARSVCKHCTKPDRIRKRAKKLPDHPGEKVCTACARKAPAESMATQIPQRQKNVKGPEMQSHRSNDETCACEECRTNRRVRAARVVAQTHETIDERVCPCVQREVRKGVAGGIDALNAAENDFMHALFCWEITGTPVDRENVVDARHALYREWAGAAKRIQLMLDGEIHTATCEFAGLFGDD